MCGFLLAQLLHPAVAAAAQVEQADVEVWGQADAACLGAVKGRQRCRQVVGFGGLVDLGAHGLLWGGCLPLLFLLLLLLGQAAAAAAAVGAIHSLLLCRRPHAVFSFLLLLLLLLLFKLFLGG